MLNELKVKFKNEITSLKKQYNTSILTEEEVNIIIEEELIQNFEKYYSNYFGRKKFLVRIWEKIATTYQVKLNKDKKKLNILLIEIFLDKNKNLTPKEQLYLLSNFLLYNEDMLDSNLIEKLKSESFILNKIIKQYINEELKHNQIIILENLIIPSNLLPLIKIYCLQNNIKIVEPASKLTKVLTRNANYMTNKVTLEDLYTLYQIDKTKKLTFLEEKKLVIESKSGNSQSKAKLIENTIYLVIDIAFEYANEFTEIQDLIQVGIIALLESIDGYKFDEGQGFNRFLTIKVKQSIEKYLSETKRLIKITSYEERKLINLNKLIDKLTTKLNRIPTDNELAIELKVDIEEIKSLKNIEKVSIELEDYLEEYDIENYPDFTTNIVEEKELSNQIRKSIQELMKKSYLTVREKEIIYLKYGFKTGQKLSFKEVAQILGISKAAANTFEKSALKKLRKLNIERLSQYMDNPQEALDYVIKYNVQSK